jgi:hypothetical protein
MDTTQENEIKKSVRNWWGPNVMSKSCSNLPKTLVDNQRQLTVPVRWNYYFYILDNNADNSKVKVMP